MYKAIKTFAGNKIAMKKGDIKEYIEKEIAEDLLRAGYIEVMPPEIPFGYLKVTPAEEVKEVVVEEVKEVEKPKRTTTRKKK